MLSGERIFPMTAVLILLIIAAIIVNVAGTIASAGDSDPFDRDEVAEYLTDVEDAEAGFIVMIAAAVTLDSLLGPALGVMLYLLFRQRHQLLALGALAFILVSSAVSLVADALSVGLLVVASDFVEGGAGDIAAGDPATLELGRVMAVAQSAALQTAWSAITAAFLALGLLLTFAPERGVVPPRWIGWVFLVAGVAGVLSWLVVLTEAGFVFFPIGILAQLIGLGGLAVWLLRSQESEDMMMASAASQA